MARKRVRHDAGASDDTARPTTRRGAFESTHSLLDLPSGWEASMSLASLKRLAEVATARPAPLWKRLLCCRFTEGSSQAAVAWDYRILKTRNRAKTLYAVRNLLPALHGYECSL